MCRGKIPLKQIAGGPQCAAEPPPGEPFNTDDFDDEEMVKEVLTIDQEIQKQSTTFGYVVVGLLLAWLVASMVWVLIRD